MESATVELQWQGQALPFPYFKKDKDAITYIVGAGLAPPLINSPALD